jgi:GNAT superfamily N-acetyltransferase/predicted nucleic acid-binding protein
MASTSTESRPVSIIEVELGSGHLDQVLGLHKGAKRYLGFLPDEGFKDRAAAGTLLAAVEGDRVLGYILFDLPANRVRIVHLCVDPALHKGGIARALVADLSARHRDRLGIQLKCRRDFPASDFWPKVGFRPVGDLPGRSQQGHLLTVWLRDHGHPDLFTELTEERELAALDQVVLEDLVDQKPDGEPSRNLLDAWVQDLVELCVTDQAHIESNACTDLGLRSKLMRQASELRYLQGGADCDDSLISRVESLAPEAGPGDHRHVALALTGDAQYLLTRDGGLLRAAAVISSELGISVLRPEQLIADLDRARRHGLYEPAALQGTELIEARLPAARQEAFTRSLLNHGAGERAFALRRLLRAGLADPSTHEVVSIEDRGGAVLAGFIRQREEGLLRVRLLRARGRDSRSRAIARQVVFAQRAEAAKQGLSQVMVDDPDPSPSMLAALEAESFVPTGDGWSCQVEVGLRVAKAGSAKASAATQERSRWPLKLTGAGIPTYLVAIQPVWAEKLFDSNLAEQTLLHRELGLGLSREHFYYRSPNLGGFLEAPARVLWYVSGGRPGHPDGELRAVSHLAEVITAPPNTLHRRFSRLGAWTRQQVRDAADRNEQVMALRVLDTELFDRPLDLDSLRALCTAAGTTFRPPQSPIEIDEQIFDLLYRRSSSYVP